ncbi:Tetraspanin-33 [Papilio xuthus]|uniref:Tetraspanin n=1 Tax=Papilio xuthus TaxID=66420 RepID=A0A194Q521_PAPXU|nr:Tetraspanin-33 [Papilio xuthus]
MTDNGENNQKMKFNKTESEYNMKSIRFLLLTITTMFILISGLMIILGISVYSHYHNFSFFYESTKSGRFLTPSILVALLGLALFVVTLFGFFGSFKQSTCMVNLYAFLLTLILIVKLVLVILTFTMGPETIMSYITVPVREYTYDPEIEAEIDSLQVSLNCCGGNSYLDYIGMEFTSNHSTVVVSNVIDGDQITVVLPRSCCVSASEVYCTRLRITSCKDALADMLLQNSSVLGVLGVSVMFTQLLGIIFALLLARCIRKMKSEKALIAWMMKEQMILARQASENKEDSVYIAKPDSSTA